MSKTHATKLFFSGRVPQYIYDIGRDDQRAIVISKVVLNFLTTWSHISIALHQILYYP